MRNASSAVNADSDKMHYFIYVDFHTFIEGNPRIIAAMQQYAAVLPARNVCIILLTPEVNLSDLPLGTVLSVDAPTPTAEELEGCLRRLVEASADAWPEELDIKDSDYHLISHLGLGMTRYEFETYASIAIVEAGHKKVPMLTAEDLVHGISVGKTEVVKQSDILELFHTEDMSEVGGMQRLKDWINNRADAFSDEAQEFGVEAPKGIAIVGVPGTGKSLVAKAIASALNAPLLRLDFGRVFSKFIGDSESRMRSALKMVESMGHLVLFADEIDKGLGGIGQGGGDSGTSSRVLGAFLTWMQENKSKVFVIVTANRIDGLPPELFRKGRLDQVFSVGLPSPAERVEVLEVHLRKRGRDIADFDSKEISAFRAASEGRVPAEIEAAVKDGLVSAFNDDDANDLEMHHIIEALEESVPMSKSHATAINAMVEWARDNATPVNYDDTPAPKGVTHPGGEQVRRMVRPRRV
jgi:AAA+ superfamily predicted ATPase